MNVMKTLGISATLIALPALAFANFTMGDKLGTDEATIRAQLEQKGYTIHEFEVEGDKIEVEVLKDGVETELTLNLTDGTLIEIEAETEDD